MTIADKLTLLASSKEALRVKLELPESLPFSEYYKHSYPFDPMTLFAGGKQGVWYDPSDKSTLFQDVAGTIPVTKDGDPIGLMKDKSGNGYHATQSVSAARPTYRTDGELSWFDTDGMDDWFETNYTPSSDWSSHIALLVGAKVSSTFAFESYSSAANNYVTYSNNNIRVSGPPITSTMTRTIIPRGAALVTSANTSGDNIGVAMTIACRNNNNVQSFLFMGRFYGFIIRHGTATAADISLVEQYLAKKSGVTL